MKVIPGAVAVSRRNHLLAALAAADAALLLPHLKEVTLSAREILHEPQDEITHVYFPNDGMVSLLAMTDDGEAIEAAAIGPEGVVGSAAAFGPRRTYCRAVVQVPMSAMRIGAPALQKAVAESARLAEVMLLFQEALTMQAQQTTACSALHGVEERLARWLLQAQDRTGRDRIPLIQEFLAQVLGVRRTTVNLVIRTLHERGAVRYRRGEVEIVDRAGLIAQSCSCYDVIRKQIEQILPARTQRT